MQIKQGVQKMRSKKKTAFRVVPKFDLMPMKRIPFGKHVQNLPSEAKIVGALLLMLAALYVFQVISQRIVVGFFVSDGRNNYWWNNNFSDMNPSTWKLRRIQERDNVIYTIISLSLIILLMFWAGLL